MAFRILPWLLLPVLASCVAPRTAAPLTPQPPPRPEGPIVPAAPAIAPERYSGEWSVAELTQGDWRYSATDGGSMARFAEGSAPPLAELRCANGTLTLVRNATINADGSAFINIRSSFAERRLPVALRGTGMLSASLPARDPVWDQIIFSRGRFLIEATRQAPVILPTRGDVARVIEDCRS